MADDMGLGKTIQTLALTQRDWQANRRGPILLVCPTSVVNNWQKEAARFTPGLPVLVHHGAGRKRGAAFKREAGRHAIVVSSYGLLQRDIKFLREVQWNGVVLDEAQNIKNPETKQARAGTVARSRLPHRPDRNAGRKQRGRPVVDHGVFEPWFPGVPKRVQAQLLRAHSGRAGPKRGRAAQARYRPVHPPETQDGQFRHLRPAGEAWR